MPWFRDGAKRLLRIQRTGGRNGIGGLTTEQADLLERMRADNSGAGAPYSASPHWKEVSDLFERCFEEEGIQNPEEQYYNLRFSGFAPKDDRLHRYVCWMYRNLLDERDSLGLLSRLRASCKEGNGFAYAFRDGSHLSLDLLLSIDDFYCLYELNPAVATDPVVVVDLGAGWGRLGHVLRSVNPKSTYVVLDLPEALIVSLTHLPRLFPGEPVGSYIQAQSIKELNKESLAPAKMWFLGPQDIEPMGDASADFVVNIGSFQEMPLEYVSAYLKQFGRIASGGHFFTRQLHEGSAHGHHLGEIDGLHQYPFPTEWNRRFLRPALFSDAFFEAGFAITSQGTPAAIA